MSGPHGKGFAEVAVNDIFGKLTHMTEKMFHPLFCIQENEGSLASGTESSSSSSQDLEKKLQLIQDELLSLKTHQREVILSAQRISEGEKQRQIDISHDKITRVQNEVENVRAELARRQHATISKPSDDDGTIPAGALDGGFVGGLRKALSTASRQVAEIVTEFQKPRTPSLRCCVMTISLPWEILAYDLLFKVREVAAVSKYLIFNSILFMF